MCLKRLSQCLDIVSYWTGNGKLRLDAQLVLQKANLQNYIFIIFSSFIPASHFPEICRGGGVFVTYWTIKYLTAAYRERVYLSGICEYQLERVNVFKGDKLA